MCLTDTASHIFPPTVTTTGMTNSYRKFQILSSIKCTQKVMPVTSPDVWQLFLRFYILRIFCFLFEGLKTHTHTWLPSPASYFYLPGGFLHESNIRFRAAIFQSFVSTRDHGSIHTLWLLWSISCFLFPCFKKLPSSAIFQISPTFPLLFSYSVIISSYLQTLKILKHPTILLTIFLAQQWLHSCSTSLSIPFGLPPLFI